MSLTKVVTEVGKTAKDEHNQNISAVHWRLLKNLLSSLNEFASALPVSLRKRAKELLATGPEGEPQLVQLVQAQAHGRTFSTSQRAVVLPAPQTEVMLLVAALSNPTETLSRSDTGVGRAATDTGDSHLKSQPSTCSSLRPALMSCLCLPQMEQGHTDGIKAINPGCYTIEPWCPGVFPLPTPASVASIVPAPFAEQNSQSAEATAPRATTAVAAAAVPSLVGKRHRGSSTDPSSALQAPVTEDSSSTTDVWCKHPRLMLTKGVGAENVEMASVGSSAALWEALHDVTLRVMIPVAGLASTRTDSGSSHGKGAGAGEDEGEEGRGEDGGGSDMIGVGAVDASHHSVECILRFAAIARTAPSTTTTSTSSNSNSSNTITTTNSTTNTTSCRGIKKHAHDPSSMVIPILQVLDSLPSSKLSSSSSSSSSSSATSDAVPFANEGEGYRIPSSLLDLDLALLVMPRAFLQDHKEEHKRNLDGRDSLGTGSSGVHVDALLHPALNAVIEPSPVLHTVTAAPIVLTASVHSANVPQSDCAALQEPDRPKSEEHEDQQQYTLQSNDRLGTIARESLASVERTAVG